jgi:hypothetical protein
MTVLNGGNVGIGTTTPQYRLHVQDSATVGTIAIGHNDYPGLIYSSASSGEFRIDNRSSTSGFITFYPNGQTTVGNERMRIIANGNVGIGTTSPDFKLRVQGNGYYSSTLEVAGNIWAYNGIQMYRAGTTVTGISWYNNSYYNWQEYMASAGATSCGPNGNLTAPSGLSAVTAWALRSRMEGVSTYGWIWETSSGGGGDANASECWLTSLLHHEYPSAQDLNPNPSPSRRQMFPESQQ